MKLFAALGNYSNHVDLRVGGYDSHPGDTHGLRHYGRRLANICALAQVSSFES